jgi:predicted nucleic acid-binding protein
MGLIPDSSLPIAGERRGQRVWDILDRAKASQGEVENALSVITVVELAHGIYRARSEADGQRRRAFVEELCQAIPVQPVTLEIAQLAGRIEGEQAAKGIVIALPDLLIGVTALSLGYSVATLNVRHFRSIPGLSVVQL